MQNQKENNKALIFNENQKISYQCYRQQCGESQKCIQSCFIFSKIWFIIRIHQQILSQKADPKQILVYLAIKKGAEKVNNLKFQNGEFIEPESIYPTQIYQFDHHTGKGKEKESDKICPFCIRSYAKQKIEKHLPSHKSIPIEKYQINGLQSYERICKCLICFQKIMIENWAKHLYGSHIDDLVYFCVKQRLQNPIMPPGWYHYAIHQITTKPKSKQEAAIKRNQKYDIVKKMNDAKEIIKRKRILRNPQPIVLSDPESNSEVPFKQIIIKPNWGLPPPTQMKSIQQKQKEIKKERKSAMRRLNRVQSQQLSMEIIRKTVYKQYFRIKAMTYKAQYFKQQFMVDKIIKQWKALSEQDILGLWQNFRRKDQPQIAKYLNQSIEQVEAEGSSESQQSQVQQPLSSEQQQLKPSNEWKKAKSRSQHAQLVAFCSSSSKKYRQQKVEENKPCQLQLSMQKCQKMRIVLEQKLKNFNEQTKKKIIKTAVCFQFGRLKHRQYVCQYQRRGISQRIAKQWNVLSYQDILKLMERYWGNLDFIESLQYEIERQQQQQKQKP